MRASGELLDRLAEEGAHVCGDALAAVGEGTAIHPRNRLKALGIRAQNHGGRCSYQLDGRGRGHRPSGSLPHATSWGMDRTVLRRGQSPIMTSRPPNPSTLHILAAQPADQSNPNTPAELQPGELKRWARRTCGLVKGSTPLELTQSQGAGQREYRCAPPIRPEARSPRRAVRAM